MHQSGRAIKCARGTPGACFDKSAPGQSLAVDISCTYPMERGGMAMKRTEAEFCRQEAERILGLAQECTDLKLRKQLTDMAHQWMERAKVKDVNEPA